MGEGHPDDDPLQAAFSFSPNSPVAGNPVNFNGNASTGNPGVYAWNFGADFSATRIFNNDFSGNAQLVTSINAAVLARSRR